MQPFMNSREPLVTGAIVRLVLTSNGFLARLDGFPQMNAPVLAEMTIVGLMKLLIPGLGGEPRPDRMNKTAIAL